MSERTPNQAELRFAFLINGKEVVVTPTVIINELAEAEGALDYLVELFSNMTDRTDLLREAMQRHYNQPREEPAVSAAGAGATKKGGELEPPQRHRPVLKKKIPVKEAAEGTRFMRCGSGVILHAEKSPGCNYAACSFKRRLSGAPSYASKIPSSVNICSSSACSNRYYNERRERY